MIRGQDPVLQALLASLFTWGVTALGAAVVFIIPHNSKKLLDVSLGFAAGVMTAASFWSLLAPAIEISEEQMGKYAFLPVAVGFACGAAFVGLSDRLIPSCVKTEFSVVDFLTNSATAETQIKDVETDESTIDNDKRYSQCAPSSAATATASLTEAAGSDPPNFTEGVRKRKSSRKSSLGDSRSSVAFRQTPSPATSLLDVEKRSLGEEEGSQALSLMPEESQLSWRRILLLILAVTVHNIPEGLAVGVGFGSVGKSPAATFEAAFNLALGIGLQNFPEGLAVSLPLAGFGYSKTRAFFYGQLSGMVEPLAALAGAAAVILMEPVLPYALSFAAGAMIYVVADDIIPEAQRNGNGKLASLGMIAGFIVMMSMDNMWVSRVCRFPRRLYADFDYARHFPKSYVEKMKRTVPRKVYDNRFGAPAITRWVVHPDDYVPGVKRPWEDEELTENMRKSDDYHGKKIMQKHYEFSQQKSKPIPAEEWTFFPGDLVQVLVGKNKGSQGTVSHVIRESNVIFVDGLHTILESEIKDAKKLKLKDIKRMKEQPLYVDKDQVQLVDPNDNMPCMAKWVLNDSKTEYIRISERTGYEIPIPTQAMVTYDYVTADKYIEAEGKDTPAAKVLERTYVPKMMTFEDEIMKSMGIEDERTHKPTYWY